MMYEVAENTKEEYIKLLKRKDTSSETRRTWENGFKWMRKDEKFQLDTSRSVCYLCVIFLMFLRQIWRVT